MDRPPALGRYDTPQGVRWVLRGQPPHGGLNATYTQVRADSSGALETTDIARHSQVSCGDQHTVRLTVQADGDLRLDEATWAEQCPDGQSDKTESMSVVKPDGTVSLVAG